MLAYEFFLFCNTKFTEQRCFLMEVAKPFSRVIFSFYSFTVIYLMVTVIGIINNFLANDHPKHYYGALIGGAIAPLFFFIYSLPTRLTLSFKEQMQEHELEKLISKCLCTHSRVYRFGCDISRDENITRFFPRNRPDKSYNPFPKKGFLFKYYLDPMYYYVYLKKNNGTYCLIGSNNIMRNIKNITAILKFNGLN